MKKFSIFFSSIFLLITLTTFNANNLNLGLKFFKISNIEISNLKTLDKKKIEKLFYNELFESNLFILEEKKINKIANENKLIDYIEFRKVYPSKLQIIIHEKETIAIVNHKKKKFYLTKTGEEIKYFKNKKLENLPNIFGKQKNFLEIYKALSQIDFPISKIKSFYYFDIGRWDIILKNSNIIKLPVKDFNESLINYNELKNDQNFKKYKIFDYRIKDQLILN